MYLIEIKLDGGTLIQSNHSKDDVEILLRDFDYWNKVIRGSNVQSIFVVDNLEGEPVFFKAEDVTSIYTRRGPNTKRLYP